MPYIQCTRSVLHCCCCRHSPVTQFLNRTIFRHVSFLPCFVLANFLPGGQTRWTLPLLWNKCTKTHAPHANANYSLLLLFLAMMPHLFWVLSFWNVLLKLSWVGICHFLLIVNSTLVMSFGQAVECWNWHRILKCLFTFLCYAGLKKKEELLCNFCNQITQTFLDLESVPICIVQMTWSTN